MKYFAVLLLIFFLSACAGNENMPSIPSGMQVTKLADVINDPAAYDGKKVLLVGSVGNVCATSGCHFMFQDSKETIDIYPKGFKLPKLKKGQPLKVYAEVTAGEKKVVISALGLEIQ